MALVSPGLQLTVTDESQYVPGAVGSVPLVLMATAQDKLNPSGTSATGTTMANAGKLQVFSSQRELVSAMGYPVFQQSSAGTALHGNELNEYGLQAAYSALGIGNRVYAIRADIDLAQLTATSNRPTGTVATGTNWLDVGTTDWGIYEWTASAGAFTKITPIVITNSSDLAAASLPSTIKTPLSSVGTIGSYAVGLSDTAGGQFDGNTWDVFYKRYDNTWQLVGGTAWQVANPTISGSISNPTIASNVSTAATITINSHDVIIGSTSVSHSVTDVATAINNAAITGITAAVSSSSKLVIYANSSATNAQIVIANKVGYQDSLSVLGIAPGTYNIPALAYGSYAQVPSWRSTDSTPRPSGSVYIKTGTTGGGANFVVKKYSATTAKWTTQSTPMYKSFADAVYGMDPVGGGINIAAGSDFVYYDVSGNTTGRFKLFTQRTAGATKVVANVVGTTPFTVNDTFTIQASKIGSATLTDSVTITLSSTSRASFVSAVSAANITQTLPSGSTVTLVEARVEANNAISLTHKYGGTIVITQNGQGTPFTDAGFSTTTTGVIRTPSTNIYTLTNFNALTYTYSLIEPTQNPETGTLWYYGSATDIDIMINDGDGWHGYQNVTSDSRGYNLSATDPLGVIVSASKPTTQTDNSALVAGDIWLDTSDLENWPKLSRYTGTTWTALDNTDQVGQNGVLFADARWDTNGMTDVIGGSLPAITSLLTSDYLDLDAPDYRLYPRGMIMVNTRRSGYNVKRFVANYYNDVTFSNVGANDIGLPTMIPDITDAWVSASGLKDNGSMYAGHQAQRHVIVSALKAAIDGNTEVREEQFQFNLIAAPAYPELIANMVGLNNDRANTAFILGDTPFRLAPNGIDLANWSNNTDNETGLTTNDPYLGVYYPGAAETNDVQGNTIVVPPSHVALRTFLHSDNVSYPWFAPAGTRRGLVDNASSVGYIDAITGEYNPIGVNQGLRDTLYENKINPITNLPGVGLVVWGQKTRNPVASAMDRVNVARLVNYIRTILATVGNGFLFEPNDKITRDQLKNIISGAINDLVSKRGIYDYLVVCDESNNTPARIARNELYVDIAIEPMKDVEFIYIPIRLYNPGDIKKLG